MELISNAIKNLFRKKSRSSLTITGIAIGITSVIIISLIGEIGKYSINEELNSLGVNGIALHANSLSSTTLNNNHLNIIKENENIKDATALLNLYTWLDVKGTTVNALTFGVSDNFTNIISLDILHGRMINYSDLLKKSKVCIVDKSFAIANYNRENIVGKNIKIAIGNSYESYTIIGVAATGKNILQNLMGNIVPSFIYLPLSTMQMYLGNDNVGQIAACFNENVNTQTAIDTLNRQLNDENIITEDLNAQKNKLNDILNIITIVLSIIASISLIVASLSVMTVMLVTVSERTREIGIKKSIGATNTRILTEFLAESLILSIIGTLIGTSIALALIYLACMITGFPFIVSFNSIIVPIIITIICGVIFGIYPAQKAARLCPVLALRQEY